MEKNLFLEKFAEQFDETAVEDITLQTVFKDLEEWSSLIALSVIAMVDEYYDITISGEDIRFSSTIEDLFNTISSRK